MSIVLRHVFLPLTALGKNIDTQPHVTAGETGKQSSHALKKERIDYLMQPTVLFMKQFLGSLS